MTKEIQPREYIDEGASREEQLIFPSRGAIGKLRDRNPNRNGAKVMPSTTTLPLAPEKPVDE